MQSKRILHGLGFSWKTVFIMRPTIFCKMYEIAVNLIKKRFGVCLSMYSEQVRENVEI